MSKRDWGNATWNLIHTLSAKLRWVSPAEMRAARDIISIAATQLPCPECARHARETLAMLQRQRIPQTPPEVQGMYWHMHNLVNKRLHKPEFPWEGLRSYANRSTKDVLRAYYAATGRTREAMRGAPSLHTGAWRQTPADHAIASKLKESAYLFLN